MKKTLNIAIAYFAAAMAGGVFFREFTKFYHYTGTTALARLHGHLLVLGTGLFLFLALACKAIGIDRARHFSKFLVLYNIALPGMAVMMLARGVVQVAGVQHLGMWDSAISGLAGLMHILMLAALVLLFICLKQAAAAAEQSAGVPAR